MHRTLLITGFEPFGGESINAAWEAVRRLPRGLGDFEIHKVCLPTVFGTAGERCIAAAEDCKPDVIICVGQAAGRDAVTPEKRAVNLRAARIPDNAGNTPDGEPVVPGGPEELPTTLPVADMAEAIRRAGFSASLSDSAGRFVCNDLMYTILHRYCGSATRAGFVHVPALPQQGSPSMPLEDILHALEAAILVC